MKTKLAVITVQSEYLIKVTDQLQRIFGDQLDIHSIQLSRLAEESIAPDEIVFSAIPRIQGLVANLFPEVTRFLPVKRSVNPVTLGALMQLEGSHKILVVCDILQATAKIVRELEEYRLGHQYIAFSRGMNRPLDFDYVVTAGDMQLVQHLNIVPKGFTNIINIGLRVIGLETTFELNGLLENPLDPVTLSRNHSYSLVMMAKKWPLSKRNKYNTTWINADRQTRAHYKFDNFVANSRIMREMIRQGEKIALLDHHIHIHGEPGVGKENLAQAIHNRSKLKSGPYQSIDCSGRDQEGLTRELFGWEENNTIYPGLLETASGGTLCIENIAHAGNELQSMLIQALKEGRLLRKNSTNYVPINMRLITTSLQDLKVMLDNNLIHRDLFFELTPFSCRVPPLSERQDDFDELVHRYLQNSAKRPDLEMDPETEHILRGQSWEGNVKELYNVLAHLACMAEDRITPEILPIYLDRSLPVREPVKRPGQSGWMDIINQIESSGFLEEAWAILKIYLEGKKNNQSFGRTMVSRKLAQSGILLSPQQLRLRQQRLNQLGLLRVRRGRAGSTISGKGEDFIAFLNASEGQGLPGQLLRDR